MGGKRRVEKLGGQNESNGGGQALLYFLQHLTLSVKSPYSNPSPMTSPHLSWKCRCPVMLASPHFWRHVLSPSPMSQHVVSLSADVLAM
jgi:hypothetical protein